MDVSMDDSDRYEEEFEKHLLRRQIIAEQYSRGVISGTVRDMYLKRAEEKFDRITQSIFSADTTSPLVVPRATDLRDAGARGTMASSSTTIGQPAYAPTNTTSNSYSRSTCGWTNDSMLSTDTADLVDMQAQSASSSSSSSSGLERSAPVVGTEAIPSRKEDKRADHAHNSCGPAEVVSSYAVADHPLTPLAPLVELESGLDAPLSPTTAASTDGSSYSPGTESEDSNRSAPVRKRRKVARAEEVENPLWASPRARKPTMHYVPPTGMENEDEVNTIRKEHSRILPPEDPEQVALRVRCKEVYHQLKRKGWERHFLGKLKTEFTLWNPDGKGYGHKDAVLGEDYFFDPEIALQYAQEKEAQPSATQEPASQASLQSLQG
jgi:hypothetical protein